MERETNLRKTERIAPWHSDRIDLNQRNCGIPDARFNRLEVFKTISCHQTHNLVVRMNEASFDSGNESPAKAVAPAGSA